MTVHDERWVELLQPLDPTTDAGAPLPGSVRYESILEAAMLTTDAHRSDVTLRPSRRRRRVVLLGIAGGVAATVAVGLVVLQPAGEVSPAAAIAAAADGVADADTFRSTLVSESPDGSRDEASATFDGSSARIVSQGDERELVTTAIGDRLWSTTDEGTTMVLTEPGDRLAPFAESCAAVLDAALRGAMVEDIGTEEVGGGEARHLRLLLGRESREALFGLTPSELAWFELEDAGSVEAIDVWVADDLIRRLRIEHAVQDDGSTYGGETVTIEFFDFGADFTIEPPT